MKALRCLAAAAVLSGIASDAIAQSAYLEPGSLLLFPVHRSGGIEGTVSFTIVCVTNTHKQPQTPTSFGGGTNVHYQYFNVVPNPANPFRPLNCVVFDKIRYMTPADTLCVLTSCDNATTAAGQEGYLVVKATDPATFKTAWDHDYLIGSEIVINTSGATYQLNAIPYEGATGFHNPTDVFPANGQCDLNNEEYDDTQDVLMAPAYVALVESQLCLVNLTGDARDLNTVYFSIWNDMEVPLSATLVFNCWFDEPLTSVSPAFEENFLKLLPNDPTELDLNCDGVGDLQTGWFEIDSIDVSNPLGQNIDDDGAMHGSLTAGGASMLGVGATLWGGEEEQENGSIFTP